MDAFKTVAVAFKKGNAALNLVEASAGKIVGLAIQTNDFWRKALYEYNETALPTSHWLPQVTAAMSALDDITDTTQFLKQLLAAVNLYAEALPKVRPGSLDSIKDDLLDRISLAWTKTAEPSGRDMGNIKLVQEMVAEMKIVHDSGELETLTTSIGEALADMGKSGRTTALLAACGDVVGECNEVTMKALHAKFLECNGDKHDMHQIVEENVTRTIIGEARAAVMKMVAADWSADTCAGSLLSAFHDIAAPAQGDCQQQEEKFAKELQNFLIQGKEVMPLYCELYKDKPVDEIVRSCRADEWRGFKGLYVKMMPWKPLTAVPETLLCSDRDTRRSASDARQHALDTMDEVIAVRAQKAEECMEEICTKLRPMAGGAQNGKDWSEGLEHSARFEQVVSHVKKPGKLISIDATVLVQLRDELKQAIDERNQLYRKFL